MVGSFFLAGAAAAAARAGAAASAALGLESSEPIWSLDLYFLSTPSLWYFQNCLEASLPATRLRIFLPPGCSSWNCVRS